MNEVQEILSEMQDVVAQMVAKHGVDRIITPEIVRERVTHYLAVGKKELEACGPDNEHPDRSDFAPMATVFTATGSEVNLCVGWPDGRKKAYMMALSEMCKTLLAQGVIFRNVCVAANMEMIAKAMEITLPDPRDRQKYDYFEEKMWRWMDKNFKSRRLAALPAEMRADCLVVSAMGPRLPDCGTTAMYEWKNGKLEFTDAPPSLQMRMELIPRWWQ